MNHAGQRPWPAWLLFNFSHNQIILAKIGLLAGHCPGPFYTTSSLVYAALSGLDEEWLVPISTSGPKVSYSAGLLS